MLCLEVCVLAALVYQVNGSKVHSALSNIVFTKFDDDERAADVHSDYYFGRCPPRDKSELYKFTKTYEQVKGKILIRVRYRAYKFNVCIERETVIHTNLKRIAYYYLWFMPVGLKEGITWELIFYP